MYRPTVRYSDNYRDHINDLFRATTLDRNQILRLALHVAAHSTDFKQILTKYKIGDVPLPLPDWGLDSHGLWFGNRQETKEGGKYVNVISTRTGSTEEAFTNNRNRRDREKKHSIRCESEITRREREISPQRVRVVNKGGITIKIG